MGKEDWERKGEGIGGRGMIGRERGEENRRRGGRGGRDRR